MANSFVLFADEAPVRDVPACVMSGADLINNRAEGITDDRPA